MCKAAVGADACTGTLRITSHAAARGRRHTAYGRATFSVASSATQTVRVPLTRTARRRLRRAPHLRLTARVQTTNGTAKPTQRRVWLTATRAGLR